MVSNQHRQKFACVIMAITLSFSGCGGGESSTPSERKPNDQSGASSEMIDHRDHLVSSGSLSASSRNPSVPRDTKAHLAGHKGGANPALNSKMNPATASEQIQQAENLLKPNSSNPLVGTWLGVANLNQDIFRQKLDRLSDAEKQDLKQKSKAFLSTQLAVDFFQDGRFTQVVAITGTDGKQKIHEIHGKWKVVSHQGDDFQVDLEESFAGSKVTEKSRVRFAMRSNRHEMIRPAVVHKDLERCEPFFLFVRQIPGGANSQVAERETNTLPGNSSSSRR